MKILVTGGSGFIGTRLVEELLAGGHEVGIYDKAPSHAYPERVILGDVRDRDALTKALAGQEAVFHLAAEHRDDVTPASLYDEVNIGGAENLCHALERTGCRRVIFTSSVAVYPLGVQAPGEDFPPEPFNRYGKSKLGAEDVFRAWAAGKPDATLTMLRPCVVFGERNRGNVYNLLRQISRSLFVMVGNGRNVKSMAYVGNLVPFLIMRMDAVPGIHLFNYADKPDLSTREIVGLANKAFQRDGWAARLRIPYGLGLMGGLVFDLLAKITGKKFALSSIRIKKFCADTSVSTERLEGSGFQRPFSLSEGLARMIRSEFLDDEASPPLFESAGG